MSALDHWREEQQSAYLYRALAAAESAPHLRALANGLADAALTQAAHWAALAPTPPPPFAPNYRARLVAALARSLGPRRMLPALAAMKVRGLAAYSGANAPSAHAGHEMPRTRTDFGQRHRSVAAGGALRAAVFGVNDGLVSNTSLILGIAGAGAEPRALLLTGLAGLLAGAFSMAAGEYVSMRSQREMYEHQIGLERDELAEYPEQEAEELALIYHARGLELDEARTVARRLVSSPEQALDTLAREELGLNPDDLGSPWGAAWTSFLAFAVGAALPLAPCFFLDGVAALYATAAVALVALFAVGAALSLFTGRSAIASGLRMTFIGGAAAAATFGIGRLFGVSLG
jgi:VIT1/CCC1 family predicted Fe2+/Mn2+ transporter